MMEVAVIATWVIMFFASVMHSNHQTTVVLVDNGRAHNAIVVKTDKGAVVIDKANRYVSLTSKEKAPGKVKVMAKKEIEKKFATVIKAAPLPPADINIYFKSNSSELTKESKEKLPEILKMIKKREPCVISIIGHTDTKGSKEANERLGLKRAEYVKNWILSTKVKIDNIEVKSYGESDLLIPTKDNVSEPRNRRVEIFIK